MKTIGVTGGIGSGKSLVCKIFNTLGIPVYESDKAAHLLYQNNSFLKKEIADRISSSVFNSSGELDRRQLAEIVFNDRKKLDILNCLVHPLVRTDFLNWKEANRSSGYIIKEAAILFESNAYKDCDEVISIVAPKAMRVKRIISRDSKTEEEIISIMTRQLSDEELISRSNYVIYNDEVQLLIPQVLKIHNHLCSTLSSVK